MFLDWWMLTILAIVYVAGLRSCYTDGVRDGYKENVEDALDLFCHALYKGGIIDLKEKDGEFYITPLTSDSKYSNIEDILREGVNDEQSRSVGNGDAGRRNMHDGD